MSLTSPGSLSPMFGSPSAPQGGGRAAGGLDPKLFTGRTIVAYRRGELKAGIQALGNKTPLKASNIASVSDFQGGFSVASVLGQSDGLRIDELDTLIVRDSQHLMGFSPATV